MGRPITTFFKIQNLATLYSELHRQEGPPAQPFVGCPQRVDIGLSQVNLNRPRIMKGSLRWASFSSDLPHYTNLSKNTRIFWEVLSDLDLATKHSSRPLSWGIVTSLGMLEHKSFYRDSHIEIEQALGKPFKLKLQCRRTTTSRHQYNK